MAATIKKSFLPIIKPEVNLRLAEIVPVLERIKKFPTTRYYGSKRKLLPWIFENLKGLKFNTVLDGFGGTGSVSLLFKAMNKEVTYLDGFSFNSYVAKAVLADELYVTLKDFQNFVTDICPRKGFISKNFQGFYYKDEENEWLDGFFKKLSDGAISEDVKSIYMYTLFQACLKKRPFNLFHRINLHLRLNKKVKRSFGNFVTWERPFPTLMEQAYKELQTSIWNGKSKTHVLKPQCISKVRGGFDLVYIDPPYISLTEKDNREDYWRRYHFLEGLSNYAEWAQLINKKSPLHSIDEPKHFLEWNQKRCFQEKLRKLVEAHKNSIVVLSYVSNAYPSESWIQEMFEEFFPRVSVHSKKHTHALSKKEKRELLFIGRP